MSYFIIVCILKVCACVQDEKKRIEDLGGCIAFMGCWRVNGTYAVSRAIGECLTGLKQQQTNKNILKAISHRMYFSIPPQTAT